MSGWTDERKARLKQLWKDGFAASAIANDLGGGLSRNAIIGQVHRMGLPGRSRGGHAEREVEAKVDAARPAPDRGGGLTQRIKAKASLPRKTVTRLTNHGNRFDLSEVNAPETAPSSFDARDDYRPRTGLSIFDLTNETCRWPVGEPGTAEFFFCGAAGADVANKRPYCGGDHCRVHHTTQLPRQRDAA